MQQAFRLKKFEVFSMKLYDVAVNFLIEEKNMINQESFIFAGMHQMHRAHKLKQTEKVRVQMTYTGTGKNDNGYNKYLRVTLRGDVFKEAGFEEGSKVRVGVSKNGLEYILQKVCKGGKGGKGGNKFFYDDNGERKESKERCYSFTKSSGSTNTCYSVKVKKPGGVSYYSNLDNGLMKVASTNKDEQITIEGDMIHVEFFHADLEDQKVQIKAKK